MGQYKSKSARGDLPAGAQANGAPAAKPKKANKKLTPDDLEELESKTYCRSCWTGTAVILCFDLSYFLAHNFFKSELKMVSTRFGMILYFAYNTV